MIYNTCKNIFKTNDLYGYLKVKEYLENNNLKLKDIIDKDWKDILN